MLRLLALLLLSISFGLAQQDLHIIPLTTDTTFTRHMEGQMQKTPFSFTVTNPPANQDLLIIVNGLDWISNPDVLISTKNRSPNFIQESEYFCYVFGADVCPIPASALREGTTFYISVFCPWTCSFTIHAQYTTETYLELNKKTTLFFTGEDEHSAQGKVVKFTIPQDFKSDHILIEASPRDTDSLDYNLGLYINQGDKIPSATLCQAQGAPSWHGGVTFSLKPPNPLYCAGCSYTMLVTTSDSIPVDIIAREAKQDVKLELNKRVYDFSFQQQRMTYILEIDTSLIPDYNKKDIHFELKSYTGNPDLYVSLNKPVLDLGAFEWSSMEYGIEALRVTPKDRDASPNKNDNKIQTFYIAIYSIQVSTFSLLAYVDSKNQKSIGFGISESGYLQSKQIESYLLSVPVNTNSGESQISVGMKAQAGNPEVYIKACPENFEAKDPNKFTSQCYITEEEIKSFDPKLPQKDNSFFIGTNNKQGLDQLNFKSGPPTCTISTGDCLYAVGLYGNTVAGQNSHYSILATHSQVHTVLQELVPVKQSLQLNEYHYYKWTLLDDINILSVHFQLTPISGAAGLYSTKTFEYPTKERFEKVACFCAHILTYCGFNPKDRPLKGTYYLAVYGFTHATYTLTAITRSSLEPSVVQLTEGVPQRYTFPTTGEPAQEATFHFKLDMNPNHKGITLFLTPLRGGNLKMLVSEGFVPHNNAAAWTSVNNQLTISDQDNQYIQGGNYYVSIVPYDPADPNKKNFDTRNWQFTLQYYSSANNMIELNEGHSTSARASVAKPAYFRFAVNKDDEDVEVKITQFGKPLQLFMATNPVNPYPNSEAKDFTGVNSIKLTHKDIAQFCNNKEETGQITGSYCPVYLGVFVDSTVEGEQEFNINIIRSGQLINLQQGVPDTHAIPAKDWHADYAINPKKGENIQLSIVSDYVLEYYVSVYDTKANPHSFQWKANEGAESVFSGLLGGNEHYGEGKIDIPHSLWKDFPEAMVIIRLKNTQKDIPIAGKPPVMTVNYLGAYIYLMDSHVVFGRVVGGTYQYYKLSGDKSTKKPLKVVLTPLTSGLPELYLSHVDSGLQPSRDKYQFRSQDPSNPSISIQDAQGSYFLSVFSPNNCSYSLVFTNLEETFVHIKGGVPLSIASTASHEDGTYLVYTPTHKNRPFKVLYSKEAGNPELYFSAILDSDKHNELPTPAKHSHNTLDKGFITVLPGTMKDVKEYMIFMKNDGTQAENKATVLISEENQNAHLPSGKSFKDSVSQGNINYYYYTSPDLADDEHVEISLVVYNGNPKLIASTKPNVAENPQWSAVKDPAKKGSSIELKIMRESGSSSGRKLTSSSVLAKGQTLYIGVVGQSDALYDIRISVGQRTMSLEDGIITTGVLNSEEQKTFTFHSKFDYSEKKVVTLVYTIIDNDKGSVSSFPEIQIGYVPETSAATSADRKVNDRIIEKNLEVRRSSSSRVYKFVAKKALYLITLTMPKQLTSTYSLSVNINGLVSLPPGNEILGYLGERSFDIYQINVQRAGNLLIQFFECFGNSSISIAKSKEDYLKNKFDTSIQTSLQSNFPSILFISNPPS